MASFRWFEAGPAVDRNSMATFHLSVVTHLDRHTHHNDFRAWEHKMANAMGAFTTRIYTRTAIFRGSQVRCKRLNIRDDNWPLVHGSLAASAAAVAGNWPQ